MEVWWAGIRGVLSWLVLASGLVGRAMLLRWHGGRRGVCQVRMHVQSYSRQCAVKQHIHIEFAFVVS